MSNEHVQETSGTARYPLVLLKSTVVFPKTRMTINIGREKSIHAVKAAQAADRRFIAASQRQSETENPGPEDAYEIATLVEIRQYELQGDGTIQIVIEGQSRVRVDEWVEREPFPLVTFREIEEPMSSGAQAEALTRHAHSLFERFTHLSRRFSSEDVAGIVEVHQPGHLADALASLVVGDHAQQQELLETFDPLARLEKLCVTLGNEIEILELENKIRQRVRQQVDKNQREYYLKEQLRAIQEELGNDQAGEVRELREKVAAKGLSDEVAVKVSKEIDRLERMPAHS
ncbi:MAG TPA: LON peptidase substrate-binding domain-containing protein, partial [Ktedonobacterales bacterium]